VISIGHTSSKVTTFLDWTKQFQKVLSPTVLTCCHRQFCSHCRHGQDKTILQRCQVSRFWRETLVFRRSLRPAVWQDLSPIFTFYLVYILPHWCFFLHFYCSTNPSTVVFESNLINSTIVHEMQYLTLHYSCSY